MCGGPKLIQLMDFPDSTEFSSESARRDFYPEIHDLAPLERREIRIRVFGIDPSATTAAFETNNIQTIKNRGTPQASTFNETRNSKNSSLGEEHRVYVRRHTSANLNIDFKGIF